MALKPYEVAYLGLFPDRDDVEDLRLRLQLTLQEFPIQYVPFGALRIPWSFMIDTDPVYRSRFCARRTMSRVLSVGAAAAVANGALQAIAFPPLLLDDRV